MELNHIIVACIIIVAITFLFIYKDALSDIRIGLTRKNRVNKKINKLAKNYDFIALKDLCIKYADDQYFTVDHILFGDKFIYLISAKSWLGFVNGHCDDEKWILTTDCKKNKMVGNPLLANSKKIQVLSRLLEVDESSFVNVVLLAKSIKLFDIECEKENDVVAFEKDLNNIVKHYEKSNVNIYSKEDIEKTVLDLYNYSGESLKQKKSKK